MRRRAAASVLSSLFGFARNRRSTVIASRTNWPTVTSSALAKVDNARNIISGRSTVTFIPAEFSFVVRLALKPGVSLDLLA